MPQEIGIRELKNQTSSIVRRVREEAAAYVITHHGRPVAILQPIQAEDIQALQKQKSLAVWQNLLALGDSLVASNASAQSAVDILSNMREEESRWPL